MRKRSRCGCRRCDANRILISRQESRCTAETNADTGKGAREHKCQQSLSHKITVSEHFSPIPDNQGLGGGVGCGLGVGLNLEVGVGVGVDVAEDV